MTDLTQYFDKPMLLRDLMVCKAKRGYALVCGDCEIAIVDLDAMSPEASEIYAKEIRRAVNAFDSMKAVLESIAAQDEFTGATPDNLPLYQSYAILNDLRVQAGEALAKAKEQ